MQTTRCVSAMNSGANTMNLSTVDNSGIVRAAWWTAFGSRPTGWVEMDLHRDWVRIGGTFPPARPLAALARNLGSTGLTGYFHLFVTGNNGVVYTSQTRPGDSNWNRDDTNSWTAIGGFFPPGAPLAALARLSNHMDLFVTGNDGVVYTSWWHEGGGWSGANNNWRPIGGFFPPGAPLAALARYPNHLDVFVTGNDGVVYASWWHEGTDWSGIGNRWRPIGGVFPPGAPIAALARYPNHLDLFITGNDGVVYTSWWHEGTDWSGIGNRWRPIGGFFPPGAPVSALARYPNHIDLFITGNDGVVYTSWYHEGGDWSGLGNRWRPIGGIFPPANPIAALCRTPDNLDLFIVGNNHLVYTSWWSAGADWSGIGNRWMAITPS